MPYLAAANLPIRTVSLLRSTDRRQRFADQARRHGLPFSFLDALDAQQAAPEILEQLVDRDRTRANRGRALAAGEIACAESHRQLYRWVVESGLPGCVIFEDDVTLNAKASSFYADLSETAPLLRDRPMVIHLGGREGFEDRGIALSLRARLLDSRVVKLRKVLRSENAMQRTCGYFITHAACRRILSNEPAIVHVADAWDFRLKNGTLSELWMTLPPLVSHPSETGSSLIEIDRGSLEAKRLRQLAQPGLQAIVARLVTLRRRLVRRYISYPLARLFRT